ncbi:hypothetical protein GS891_11610 [Rhodococcus hoagii]|nr:hypothetical protein [Prescottella equi]
MSSAENSSSSAWVEKRLRSDPTAIPASAATVRTETALMRAFCNDPPDLGQPGFAFLARGDSRHHSS